ncbi:hypothetical protein AOR11_00895 [Vibrio alginolyticus]|nr:hypothetical protein AOR11_00895 [Vibrio alginolyticus]
MLISNTEDTFFFINYYTEKLYLKDIYQEEHFYLKFELQKLFMFPYIKLAAPKAVVRWSHQPNWLTMPGT